MIEMVIDSIRVSLVKWSGEARVKYCERAGDGRWASYLTMKGK